jgi:transcription antitermination factor NusG
MNGRNWYAVYTKPQAERKVAALLSKKRIDSFCPHNRVITGTGNKRKMVYEPLFQNFVFVCVSESEMTEVRKTNYVVNFVYWLGKPAVINTHEIENIAKFNGLHYNIKVEKVPINAVDIVHISNNTDEPAINGIQVKTANVKLILPSLGFALLAETTNTVVAGYAEKNTETLA